MSDRRFSDDAIEAMFTYHRPGPEQIDAHNAINEAAKHFAHVINEYCPDCPDKSAAIRLVREARMTASAGIACEPGKETVKDWSLREQLGYKG